MREYLFFKLRYFWFTIICLRCTAKWFSDSATLVLPWTKLIPFGRPLGHALYSENLRILNRQRSMWLCSWGVLDWINYSNIIQETSPDIKRGSPNLPSNWRSCSLECGCLKQCLGREGCVMNILSAEDKAMCREDTQAQCVWLIHAQLFATLWIIAPKILYLWNFSGKNPEMSCQFLLQGIFPTQGLNPSLPHPLYWLAGSFLLSHLGNKSLHHWVILKCLT